MSCATRCSWWRGRCCPPCGPGGTTRPRCGVLFGQAGDECRGSCGIRLLRRVLDRLGYGRVETLSLNVRGIDRGTGLPSPPPWSAAVWPLPVWGDTLALLRNQTRPYEAVPGTAEALWRRWTEDLGQDLAGNRGLTRRENPAPLPGDGGRIPGGGAGAP